MARTWYQPPGDTRYAYVNEDGMVLMWVSPVAGSVRSLSGDTNELIAWEACPPLDGFTMFQAIGLSAIKAIVEKTYG